MARLRGGWKLWLILAVVALAGVATLVFASRSEPERLDAHVELLTSLPLVWGEGDMKAVLDGKTEPNAAMARLDTYFIVDPVDSLDQLAQRDPSVLLMVQPRALTPKELVVLDDWVGKGGKALILADPTLQWESDWNLGDRRRPLFTSMLSPLFRHWGVDLTLPVEDEPEAETKLEVAGNTIETAAPGRFVEQTRKTSRRARCELSDDDFRADCAVGKGRAVLLADADLLDPRFWKNDGFWSFTGDRNANMHLVREQVASLIEN